MEELLDDLFTGHERLSRDEIQRRAVAADLPASELATLDALPEGEYAQDEGADAIGTHDQSDGDDEPGVADAGPADAALDDAGLDDEGVAAEELDEEALLRELASLHRTRHETFLHASTQALQHHSERTTQLELEYLRRHPERQIDPERLRSGARQER